DHSEYTYDKLKLSMRQQQFMICCVLDNKTPAMTYKQIREPRGQKDATIKFKATKSMRKVTVKSLPIEPMQTPRALGRRLRAVRDRRDLRRRRLGSDSAPSRLFLGRAGRKLARAALPGVVRVRQRLGGPPTQILDGR